MTIQTPANVASKPMTDKQLAKEVAKHTILSAYSSVQQPNLTLVPALQDDLRALNQLETNELQQAGVTLVTKAIQHVVEQSIDSKLKVHAAREIVADLLLAQ